MNSRTESWLSGASYAIFSSIPLVSCLAIGCDVVVGSDAEYQFVAVA
ncbi:hypothetical protein [Mycobacterium leprae]|nr:hypothetical protein [Mycobacterium leprae]